MFAALVVRGGTESPRRRRFEFKAIDETVEGKVEVEARLFAVGDHIEPGFQLVAHSDGDRVIDELGAIRFAELIKMLTGKFQPAREWIAADDSRSQRAFFHFGC
jgi:hypothetical protein